MLAGRVKGFIGLGGNFVRTPSPNGTPEKAWQDRSADGAGGSPQSSKPQPPVNGGVACLPCLGQSEDKRRKEATLTMEDSLSCIRGSISPTQSASRQTSICCPNWRSSPAWPTWKRSRANRRRSWVGWVGDYGRSGTCPEETYPESFIANERMLRMAASMATRPRADLEDRPRAARQRAGSDAVSDRVREQTRPVSR